jgi:hypothetical protein
MRNTYVDYRKIRGDDENTELLISKKTPKNGQKWSKKGGSGGVQF